MILFLRVHSDYGKGVATLLGLSVDKLQQAAQEAEEDSLGSPQQYKIVPIVHKMVKSEISTTSSRKSSTNSKPQTSKMCNLF